MTDSDRTDLYVRRTPWRGADAHALLDAHRDRFAALLEHPGGGGRQLLVSREGERHVLPGRFDRAAARAWVARWKSLLRDPVDAPDAGYGVRCLVYAAYEANALVEDCLPPPAAPPPALTMALHLPAWSCCLLPEAGEAVLVSSRGRDDLDMLEAMLRAAPAARPESDPVHPGGIVADRDSRHYLDAVRRTREYVTAGDVFQANIARFWHAPLPARELPALYARLRRVNPAPFAGWARLEGGEGTLTLLSASPERLFSLTADGVVETRPIAGTRRRGAGDEDDDLRSELLLSEKERAEHIMLVDLERNDLGRVCAPGTVEVNERMAIERYATVQHIVSNVRGRLAPGRDVVDLFLAMFPGGTITGCPKVRCMEIIRELEGRPRGPYTGGLGYVAWDGSADMNILIRTFWHHGGRLHWAAGAGIVADSDPAAELAETALKAEGLLRALAER